MGGGHFFPKMSHQKLALVEIEKLHLWVLTSCRGIKQRNWNELLLGTIKYWSRIAQPQLALSLEWNCQLDNLFPGLRVASCPPLEQWSPNITSKICLQRLRGEGDCWSGCLHSVPVIEHTPVVFSRSGLEAGWSELQSHTNLHSLRVNETLSPD